jgi:hypothetical protein
LRDLNICLINGKPNIIIKTGQQSSPWLYNTGAVISLISEQLYNQLRPIPPIPFFHDENTPLPEKLWSHLQEQFLKQLNVLI